MVLDIEKTLIGAGNGEVVVIPNTVLTKYRDDLNMDRLLTHLKMVPDIVKRYSCDIKLGVKATSPFVTIILDHTCGYSLLRKIFLCVKKAKELPSSMT